MPSGLCAPSRISASRRSSRPGSATSTSASIAWPTNASAASRAPPIRTSWPATRWAYVSSGRTTIAPSCATASFSRAIVLDGVSEHVGVLEPDVRQQDDPGAENVRRIEPAAETGLDDGDVDVAHRRTRRARPQSRSRTASRRGARPPVARARRPPRSRPPRRSAGSARSSSRRAARSSCPTESPSERRSCSMVTAAVDFPFVPTTWIAGYASCGSPSSASSARIRSSPNLARPRTQRVEPLDGGHLAIVRCDFDGCSMRACWALSEILSDGAGASRSRPRRWRRDLLELALTRLHALSLRRRGDVTSLSRSVPVVRSVRATDRRRRRISLRPARCTRRWSSGRRPTGSFSERSSRRSSLAVRRLLHLDSAALERQDGAPRARQDDVIRALGPRFHPLAEVTLGNVTGWDSWVTGAPGRTWFDAGVEFRKRMAAGRIPARARGDVAPQRARPQHDSRRAAVHRARR